MDYEHSDHHPPPLSQQFADELHDGPMQWLVGAKMQAEAMLHSARDGHPPDTETLERLLSTLQSGIQSARQLMQYWIHPPLRDGCWHAILQHQLNALIDSFPGQSPRLTYDLEPQTEPLSTAAADLVARILREAVWNAIRYASATEIQVSARCSETQLELKVQDNGHGFTPREATGTSRGLSLIQERAAHLGGSADLTSKANVGTTWLIRIPLSR